MLNDCRLCTAISKEGQLLPENFVLLESDHFVVIPTLGQFVEGWVMIVSKHHRKSLNQHTPSEINDLHSILIQAIETVQKIYGPVLIFEHGPADIARLHAGCCIAHTHLHIAPCGQRQKFISRIPFPITASCSIQNIVDVKAAQSGYLLVGLGETPSHLNIYSIDTPLPRQYLRQVLAATVGMEPFWDWGQNPSMENVIKTIQNISPTLCSISTEVASCH